MPVIHVEMFSGRDAETRKQLVKTLTDAYVDVCGGKPQSVHIILKDISKDHWSVGGKLCGDLYPD